MIQSNIDFTSARAAGAAAGELALERAERTDPEFRARALRFIVAFIRRHGEATGESATDAAIKAGITAPDARAFGPVYADALKRGLIRVVAYVPRSKGHGSMGGKRYAPGVRWK